MSHRNLIGPQVRRLRSQKHWTQEIMAAKLQIAGLDISRSTLAKIESRLIAVKDFELFYFSSVLQVSLDQLFPPIHSCDPEIHERVCCHLNIRV